MLTEIIKTQKIERDCFLETNFVPRDELVKIQQALSNNLVKIISGPRRAGKSVFAIEILKKENFAYLNFDDERLSGIDTERIMKSVHEVYGDVKLLLFDEIQNLNKWELFINRLQRIGYNILLTGSNSRLLSREMATHLTGRFVPFYLYTFSFKEFLHARNMQINTGINIHEQGKILHLLDEYQKIGGYPEIIVHNLNPKEYLNILFSSIIFKDVVKRYNVRYSQSLYKLALLLISNYAGEYSYTKLKNLTEIGSVHTIQNYIAYLEEAYLVFSVKRFSFKPKEQLKAPSKIYLYDTGLAESLRLSLSPDMGKLMENRVAIELIRRRLEFFYFKDVNNSEVDFIIKKDLKLIELVQVCYNVSDEKTKRREVKSLLKAGKQLNIVELTIITWDYENVETTDNHSVNYIPLWKWLLN